MGPRNAINITKLLFHPIHHNDDNAEGHALRSEDFSIHCNTRWFYQANQGLYAIFIISRDLYRNKMKYLMLLLFVNTLSLISVLITVLSEFLHIPDGFDGMLNSLSSIILMLTMQEVLKIFTATDSFFPRSRIKHLQVATIVVYCLLSWPNYVADFAAPFENDQMRIIQAVGTASYTILLLTYDYFHSFYTLSWIYYFKKETMKNMSEVCQLIGKAKFYLFTMCFLDIIWLSIYIFAVMLAHCRNPELQAIGNQTIYLSGTYVPIHYLVVYLILQNTIKIVKTREPRYVETHSPFISLNEERFKIPKGAVDVSMWSGTSYVFGG
jgi:hypothetical protein